MKVKEAIKYLESYDEDEEIIIAWWDKDSFSIPDEDWDRLAYYVCEKTDWSVAHEALLYMFEIAKEEQE